METCFRCERVAKTSGADGKCRASMPFRGLQVDDDVTALELSDGHVQRPDQLGARLPSRRYDPAEGSVTASRRARQAGGPPRVSRSRRRA